MKKRCTVVMGIMLSGIIMSGIHAAPAKKGAQSSPKQSQKKSHEEFQCPVLVKLGSIPEIDAPILLMFYASWCPNCHKMIPAFNEFLSLNPTLNAYQIDVGGSGQSLGQKFEVSGVPTMVVIQRNPDGTFKEIRRFIGSMSLQELEKKVTPVACPIKK